MGSLWQICAEAAVLRTHHKGSVTHLSQENGLHWPQSVEDQSFKLVDEQQGVASSLLFVSTDNLLYLAASCIRTGPPDKLGSLQRNKKQSKEGKNKQNKKHKKKDC